MKNVLVYGWYNHGNIGDELFKEAYLTLFPEINFVFANHINKDNLANKDAVFIGGGSLLDGKPNFSAEILDQIPVYYLGVGDETNIHPIHQKVLEKAKFIGVRNLNPKIPGGEFIPDLVYALKPNLSEKVAKSVLIIPNIELVPKWTDAQWKYSAWEYFKNQIAQFLDYLVENEYQVDFLAMCQNSTMNDHWAATEIINKMARRSNKLKLISSSSDFSSVSKIVSSYESIITQRFHGIVAAEICQTSYLAICHHDKLKNCYPQRGNFLSYYEIYKDKLIKEFKSLNKLILDQEYDFSKLKF